MPWDQPPWDEPPFSQIPWDHPPWSAPPEDISNVTTIMTKILVFLDTSWPYYGVVDYVNFVLQHLNINPHASSVTLLAASDGSPIVNTTHYLSELYETWNATTHSWYQQGFSLPIIYNAAVLQWQNITEIERNASSVGGTSLIALLIPSPVGYVPDRDFDYCRRLLDQLNRTMPDLHFIFYAGGAVVRFRDFVSDPREDLFQLSFDIRVKEAAVPVVQRIRKVQRRIAVTCEGPATFESLQFARLGSLNFYRMMPKYFCGKTNALYLTIQPLSTISFTVCTSRSIRLPHRNISASNIDQQCSQITSTPYNYDLVDACSGYSRIWDCPPLYLSVQAQDFADVTQVSCTEAACQSPDQATYAIIISNTGSYRCNVFKSVAMLALIRLLQILI